MTTQETKLAAGKRIAAIASGQAFKDNGKEGEPDVEATGAPDVARPLHAKIGIEDDVQEHESERLNPGSVARSPSGAPGDKPGSPSNSA